MGKSHQTFVILVPNHQLVGAPDKTSGKSKSAARLQRERQKKLKSGTRSPSGQIAQFLMEFQQQMIGASDTSTKIKDHRILFLYTIVCENGTTFVDEKIGIFLYTRF